tara:strand:+ start:295 stop:648 length:354 start_codon:yes stop_codon:yes gene_type:complete
MKKLTVAIGAFALSANIVLLSDTTADSMEYCTKAAGQERYSAEMDCYEEFGPKSGLWTVQDRQLINSCLETVNWSYSDEVTTCQERYVVEDNFPPIDSKKAAVGSAGVFGVIFALMP